MAAIESVVVGTNADLIRRVAVLYLEDGDVVVDATFGRGEFWRHLPDVNVIGHDLALDGVHLAALPEADGTVDVVVLDPPYRLDAGTTDSVLDTFTGRYGLNAGELETPADLEDLYRAGIVEAARVLNARGRLFVKAQDFVDGRRFYSALGLVERAGYDADLTPLDVFVLYAGAGPASGSWARQYHARRVHSYLVVLARSPSWRRRPTHRPNPLPEALRPERLFDLGGHQ